MRHAYCIMAHHQPELLKILLSLIDDERNDIFLLIDKKADIGIFSEIETKKSHLFFTPRVNVHWGAMSFVKAELILLKSAYLRGPYAYYHLLSGVDLPLQSQDQIHCYCDAHQGDEFIGFLPIREYEEYCVRYHHIFLEFMRLRNPLVRKVFSAIRHFIIACERRIGYVRSYPYEIRKGANWFSLTNDAVGYLISKERLILHKFWGIHTADEIVFHTIFAASPFMSKVHVQGKNGHSNMRMIDWKRGTPYVWRMENFDELVKSGRFFARKFSIEYPEIVYAIARYVRAQS